MYIMSAITRIQIHHLQNFFDDNYIEEGKPYLEFTNAADRYKTYPEHARGGFVTGTFMAAASYVMHFEPKLIGKPETTATPKIDHIYPILGSVGSAISIGVGVAAVLGYSKAKKKIASLHNHYLSNGLS